jgi:phosphoglycolate phosphatase
MMPSPKIVLFDWDGTLVNSLQGLFEAHNYVRDYLGHEPWTFDEYKTHMQFSSRELYPRLYGERAEEAIKILYDYYAKNHTNNMQIMPYAEQLLNLLKERKVPMGVVSNKRHDMLKKEVEHLGWGHYFESTVGAGVAEKDKPAADPVNYALNIMNIHEEPDNIWYIGDTVTDLQTAKAVKCKAILVLNGENKQDLISTYEPFLTADNCMDIVEYISE